MDGKGSWKDNVFVEHLRLTIKYEEVYLRLGDRKVTEAKRSMADLLTSITVEGHRPALTECQQTRFTIRTCHYPAA